MTVKRMKSDQVRVGWKDVLQYVRQGGTVVVEHYNEAVADLVPHGGEVMKLFLVKRTEEPGYDEYDGIVVRAENEARAIEIATGADEYGIHYTGLAPHNIEVTEITPDGDEAVILSSFNAG